MDEYARNLVTGVDSHDGVENSRSSRFDGFVKILFRIQFSFTFSFYYNIIFLNIF